MDNQTEIALTAKVPKEMLDATNIFAYMRHYDSGVDGDGPVDIAVFHPSGVIGTFLDSDEQWIYEYAPDVDPMVPEWDLKLLSLAGKAEAIGASYLILEARGG